MYNDDNSVYSSPADLLFYFVCSISGKVDNSVKQMGRLLSEIKGGGQGQAISKSGQRIKQFFSSTTLLPQVKSS